MKVSELIKELEFYKQDAEVSILLLGVIYGKNGAKIDKLSTYRDANDMPGIILISKIDG